jgi:archaellin
MIMKKLQILFCFLAVTTISLAQKPGTYGFRLTFSDSEDTTEMTIIVAQTTGKMAIQLANYELLEKVVVDKTQLKMLELIDYVEENEKEAFESTWESSFSDEVIGMSLAFSIFNATDEDMGNYQLLPDKKVIHGLSCQKVALKQNGVQVGTGWVALGVDIQLQPGFGFMHIKEGTIVEFNLTGNERTFSCIMTFAQTTIENPTAMFSLTIPEGYSTEVEELIEEGESVPPVKLED